MPDNKHISSMFIALRSTLAKAVSSIVPPKEIEDIVQETYVRICQVENPDSITHPRSFLLKVAKNLAFDYVKRAESRLTSSAGNDNDDHSNGQPLGGDATYNTVAAKQEFAHFCESVRQLPVQCRRVFVLKKVYGYSQREIAAQLKISESTVEKHIATGIKKCTAFMASRQHPSAGVASAPKKKAADTPRSGGGQQ